LYIIKKSIARLTSTTYFKLFSKWTS